MSLIVAGAGPENIRFLTEDVLQAVETAKTVAGFERIACDLKSIRSDIFKVKTLRMFCGL